MYKGEPLASYTVDGAGVEVAEATEDAEATDVEDAEATEEGDRVGVTSGDPLASYCVDGAGVTDALPGLGLGDGVRDAVGVC